MAGRIGGICSPIGDSIGDCYSKEYTIRDQAQLMPENGLQQALQMLETVLKMIWPLHMRSVAV